jgi:hypothetical protein
VPQLGDAVLELVARQQKTILGRSLHRIAERADMRGMIETLWNGSTPGKVAATSA